jgi:hypothetical protein
MSKLIVFVAASWIAATGLAYADDAAPPPAPVSTPGPIMTPYVSEEPRAEARMPFSPSSTLMHDAKDHLGIK